MPVNCHAGIIEQHCPHISFQDKTHSNILDPGLAGI
jgi:hypothetical protein